MTDNSVDTAIAAEYPNEEPTLVGIFLVFFKIGALAFGGVYSMLSFFQREIVDKHRWLSQEEFTEGVAIGQMTPGPPIINTGIFIGYRLRGIKGALAATLGQVIPGFAIVLVVGYLYMNYKETPALVSVMKGVGAAVVGLLLSVVLKMGKQLVNDKTGAALAVGAFTLLAVMKFNAIGIIIAAGVAGYLVRGRGRA